MLKNLNEVDLKDLLANLEKEFGSEAIAAVMKEHPTVTVRHDVDWLHLHCCGMVHDQYECRYYSEEELAECWSKTSHRYWLDAYFSLLHRMNLDTKSFTRLQTEAANLMTYIAASCHRVDGLFWFLSNLCSENPMALLPPIPRKAPAPVEDVADEADRLMTASTFGE